MSSSGPKRIQRSIKIKINKLRRKEKLRRGKPDKNLIFQEKGRENENVGEGERERKGRREFIYVKYGVDFRGAQKKRWVKWLVGVLSV